MRYKFAFIGCGKIAHFHAEAIQHLGGRIEAVVAREHSVHLKPFAQKFQIPNRFERLQSFIQYAKQSKSIDAIIVCTPWDVTENILKDLLSLNLPLLVEKPAVLSVQKLNSLKRLNLKNLCVAYNRRFYDFMPEVQKFIRQNRLLCVDMLSADPLEMIRVELGPKVVKSILYYYTTHIVDLMFFLLGEVKISKIHAMTVKGKKSWVVEALAVQQQCPVQFKILMDSPQNSYLKVFSQGEVLEICPFEKMRIYDRIDKIAEAGKNVYRPRISREIGTSAELKPGFLNQMKYFMKNFVAQRNASLKHIKELESITNFCDRLKAAK